MIYSSNNPDIYVISYPKSGRTWLRLLIGRYLSLKYRLPENDIISTEVITKKSDLPIVSFTHDGSAMLDKKKYKELSYNKQVYVNKKVILMGRGIKDTLVSAYFQATKRINVFDGTISEFIYSEEFGIHKILTFYDIWIRNQHIPKSFLFIRYEDLHQNARSILTKVLLFIGETNIDKNFLYNSIEYCSFNNLKNFEKQGRFDDDMLKVGNINDTESYKVRKGIVGGYKEYLSSENQKFIDDKIKEYKFKFTSFNKLNEGRCEIK